MDRYEDPTVTPTGVDALRALGMSDDAISRFASAAGLPSGHVDQIELRTGLRPSLYVNLRGEGLDPGSVVVFLLPLPGSSAFERAVAALPQGAARWDQSESAQTFDWDDEALIWRVRYEHTGAIHLEVLELAVGGGALWFLGKLGDAYVSRIADRLAETTFKAVERIRLRRSPANDCVIIKVPGGTTTIVLPEPLTDEAREAFIDLDPAVDGICGKTLYWDQDTRVWVSRDQPPPSQEVHKLPLPPDDDHDWM